MKNIMKSLVLIACLYFGVNVNGDGIEAIDINNENEGGRDENYVADKGKHQATSYETFVGYNEDDFREFKSKQKQRNSYNEEERQKRDEIFGYTGPTANDEPENLMRPCALDDWQCVRKYFAANAKCTPAYGPIPDPLKISSTIFFTAVNLTTNYANSLIRGLSTAKINDFYVNKKSGNLVFAIDVQYLNQTTPRGYYRYRRTGKESIVLADYSTVDFQSVTFTAVIPKVPYLRLDLADVHVDVKDGFPPYYIGPGAVTREDPDVIRSATEFRVLLPFIVRESLLFEAQLFTAIYIQKNICDFGLKLVSV